MQPDNKANMNASIQFSSLSISTYSLQHTFLALEHDISAKESKMSDMKSNTESDNETKKQLDGGESVQTTRLYPVSYTHLCTNSIFSGESVSSTSLRQFVWYALSICESILMPLLTPVSYTHLCHCKQVYPGPREGRHKEPYFKRGEKGWQDYYSRSEEHTSELQSQR